MKRFCFLLFLSLLPTLFFAQSTWYMDLPGTSFGEECTATYDGGVVSIAYLEHRITKLDAAGTLLWSVVIDTNALQYLTAVTETEDHGIVVVGSHDNWTATLVWKLDENGNMLWQKRFNPTGQGLTVNWVCPAHGDGGFLIGGGECSMQAYVIRCDANGAIIWQKQYFGLTSAATGFFSRFVQASGSGYIGTFSRLESGDLDWGILKINDTGDPVWAKALDEGLERDEVEDAVSTAAGGLAVLGVTTNYQAPNNEYKMTFTVFDATGSVQNYRVYDYTEQLQPVAIAQTNDGGFVMTGSTFSLETMVVKTDGLGGVQWKTLGTGNNTQSGSGVAPAPGDMFYLAAHDFNHKATVAKLSALTGQGICTETPFTFSPATQTVMTLPLTVSSITGTATVVSINYPYHSDNTPATLVCGTVATDQPVAAPALTCSPNPFASQLHVDLGAALPQGAVLRLHDLQGRIVAQSVVAEAVQTLDWSLPTLPDGMYLLQLEADGHTQSIKLMHQGE